LTQFNSFCRTD